MAKDYYMLRYTRTEYGKEIRKQYENHNLYEKRGNMVKLEPRTDGISNTITTVLKDTLVLEVETEREASHYGNGFGEEIL